MDPLYKAQIGSNSRQSPPRQEEVWCWFRHTTLHNNLDQLLNHAVQAPLKLAHPVISGHQ